MANEPYRLTQTGAEVQADLNDIEALGLATEETAGKMSAADKTKLDNLPSGSELASSLSGKVDKVEGKGLSTNDYTDAEKAKVDSALQSETDPTVPAWAKQPDKPSYTAQEVGALPANTPIPTALSELSEDNMHRVVTDMERAIWSGKYTKPSTGIPASDLAADVIPDVTGKADKVSSPVSGNFAGLDANGNLTDSGKKASDFQPTIDSSNKLSKSLIDGVDSTPTANSANLVESGGVKTYVDGICGDINTLLSAI